MLEQFMSVLDSRNLLDLLDYRFVDWLYLVSTPGPGFVKLKARFG